MKGFIRLPGARILGAFLAGMLLVAAAVFVYNLYGLPHQSWAEDNGLNALAAARCCRSGAGHNSGYCRQGQPCRGSH